MTVQRVLTGITTSGTPNSVRQCRPAATMLSICATSAPNTRQRLASSRRAAAQACICSVRRATSASR